MEVCVGGKVDNNGQYQQQRKRSGQLVVIAMALKYTRYAFTQAMVVCLLMAVRSLLSKSEDEDSHNGVLQVNTCICHHLRAFLLEQVYQRICQPTLTSWQSSKR